MFVERPILPLSLTLLCFSNVLNVASVPINSYDPSPTAIWVTETVWPRGPSSSLTLAAAEMGTSSNSVSRVSNERKKEDYDTVPVDGSENAESVQVRSWSSANPASNPADASTTMSDVASASLDPAQTTQTTIDTGTSSPIVVYTVISSDPTTTTPSLLLDTESISADAPVSITIPLPVAMFSSVDYIGTPLTQPMLAATNTPASNDTVSIDDPSTDEYSPEEESAYWATATEPSVSYSDSTITCTLKTTSFTIIYANITTTTSASAHPVSLAMVGTTSPSASADPVESTQAAAPFVAIDPGLVYTPVESSFADAATVKPNSTSTSAEPSVTVNSSWDPVTTASIGDPAITESAVDSITAPSVSSAVPANSVAPESSSTTDPTEETSSGTIITFVDVTTTITSDPTVTSTFGPMVTSSDESTSTTTVWVTSTIITDVNAKLRRRMQLVTRG